MPEPVAHSCVLPPDAPLQVRQALGMSPGSDLRIAFIAGPGDAVGTFDCWSRDEHEPRTPVIAYSTMFYSVVDAISAEALILVEHDKQPSAPNPRFRFSYTPRRRDRTKFGYRMDERDFARRALRHLRDYRPDVILVGTDAPTLLIDTLPPARRIILTAHNTYWPAGCRKTSLKARVRYWGQARSLRRIDVALSTSSECAAQIAALGGPSGTKSFTEVPQILPAFYPEEIAPSPSVRRLLFVGRIEAEKGVLDLLEAFKIVAADHPELTLEYVGTGSVDELLRAAILASPLADRITFHGHLMAQDVHNQLASSDLLICPTRSSFNEGLALVVVEAAVHGKPTLLSSIVPAKGLLPRAHVEFPVDDTLALSRHLRHIIDTPKEYAKLQAELASNRAQFRDRRNSWGSMLYRALSA